MKKGMKALKRVAAVGLALALTGCGASGTSSQSTAGQGQDAKTEAAGGDAGTADLPTLRVAMMPFITSLPTEYIRKNKLDEKAGFKMDTIMFATGAPMNEALAADLWDVGAMGAAAALALLFQPLGHLQKGLRLPVAVQKIHRVLPYALPNQAQLLFLAMPVLLPGRNIGVIVKHRNLQMLT